MSNQQKSEVELAYAAIAAKFGVQRQWGELHPQEQHVFVQACNMIFSVVQDKEKF